MNLREFAGLGWNHAVSAASDLVYLKTGADITKPVVFYGLVTTRCNGKCRYCEYWRLKEPHEELSIAQWQAALMSIAEFVGNFSINFSGGEPLVKPGFLDLLAWCRLNGIKAGVTTNGLALTRANAVRLVTAYPFNVNISVDAPTAEVHDYLRGVPGSFEKISRGIGYLREEQQRRGIQFPIIVKPTVNARNFRELPALVEWADRIGGLCVSPQPMDRWSPESKDELWIEEGDLAELETVVERLVELELKGAPILTPPHVLRMIPDHFRGKQAPRSSLPCRAGLRNYFIRANGDVELCVAGFPPIGNVKTETAKEIWYGDRARQVRRDTVACDRLCLITCSSQKTLANKVGMALRILRGVQ